MPADLFSDDAPSASRSPSPLAERMRPRTLDEIVGQDELLAPGRPLREAIEHDTLQSIIL
jgi:putative ATPase